MARTDDRYRSRTIGWPWRTRALALALVPTMLVLGSCIYWAAHPTEALSAAIMSGRPASRVGLWVALGARIDGQYPGPLAPLHIAATCHRPDCLEALLRAGAAPDAECPPGSGMTSLHDCAIVGEEEGALLLLGYGADPTVRDSEGRTAADVAEQAGQVRLASVLRKAERSPLRHR
jgi:uncharacterized protein